MIRLTIHIHCTSSVLSSHPCVIPFIPADCHPECVRLLLARSHQPLPNLDSPRLLGRGLLQIIGIGAPLRQGTATAHVRNKNTGDGAARTKAALAPCICIPVRHKRLACPARRIPAVRHPDAADLAVVDSAAGHRVGCDAGVEGRADAVGFAVVAFLQPAPAEAKGEQPDGDDEDHDDPFLEHVERYVSRRGEVGGRGCRNPPSDNSTNPHTSARTHPRCSHPNSQSHSGHCSHSRWVPRRRCCSSRCPRRVPTGRCHCHSCWCTTSRWRCCRSDSHTRRRTWWSGRRRMRSRRSGRSRTTRRARRWTRHCRSVAQR